MGECKDAHFWCGTYYNIYIIYTFVCLQSYKMSQTKLRLANRKLLMSNITQLLIKQTLISLNPVSNVGIYFCLSPKQLEKVQCVHTFTPNSHECQSAPVALIENPSFSACTLYFCCQPASPLRRTVGSSFKCYINI